MSDATTRAYALAGAILATLVFAAVVDPAGDKDPGLTDLAQNGTELYGIEIRPLSGDGITKPIHGTGGATSSSDRTSSIDVGK